jgi:hypothetical protein
MPDRKRIFLTRVGQKKEINKAHRLFAISDSIF